uniref:Uncharacterized protein n=1 Tax=Rhizophora mucronata TaxID=61149 RepID=A0A2P2QWY6_RHIMU
MQYKPFISLERCDSPQHCMAPNQFHATFMFIAQYKEQEISLAQKPT